MADAAEHTRHYTEADLLETWYMKPGESMPVMMHLAECAACAEQWERVDRKLRTLRDCRHESRSDRNRHLHLVVLASAAAIALGVLTCSGVQ